MITVTSTSNAPGTTIQVYFISLDFILTDSNLNVSVRLFDVNQKPIQLPQPVRQMTAAEKGAALSLVSNTGETFRQLAARACAAYISAVYGVTYATV